MTAKQEHIIEHLTDKDLYTGTLLRTGTTLSVLDTCDAQYIRQTLTDLDISEEKLILMLADGSVDIQVIIATERNLINRQTAQQLAKMGVPHQPDAVEKHQMILADHQYFDRNKPPESRFETLRLAQEAFPAFDVALNPSPETQAVQKLSPSVTVYP